MTRFSKAALRAHIEGRIAEIEKQFPFAPHGENGTSQIIGVASHSKHPIVETAVAYGERDALCELIDAFEL